MKKDTRRKGTYHATQGLGKFRFTLSQEQNKKIRKMLREDTVENLGEGTDLLINEIDLLEKFTEEISFKHEYLALSAISVVIGWILRAVKKSSLSKKKKDAKVKLLESISFVVDYIKAFFDIKEMVIVLIEKYLSAITLDEYKTRKIGFTASIASIGCSIITMIPIRGAINYIMFSISGIFILLYATLIIATSGESTVRQLSRKALKEKSYSLYQCISVSVYITVCDASKKVTKIFKRKKDQPKKHSKKKKKRKKKRK